MGARVVREVGVDVVHRRDDHGEAGGVARKEQRRLLEDLSSAGVEDNGNVESRDGRRAFRVRHGETTRWCDSGMA